MKIIKKILGVSAIVLSLLAMTNIAFAAGTDVQFTADTNILLTGPAITITVLSGTKVSSYSVSTTTLTMNVDTGSVITVKSANLYNLNSNVLTTRCSSDKTYTYVSLPNVTTPAIVTIAPFTTPTISCATTVISDSGSGGRSPLPKISLPVIIPRIIPGCGTRTTGFSTQTGESCLLNISTTQPQIVSLGTSATLIIDDVPIPQSQKFSVGKKSTSMLLIQKFLKNDVGVLSATPTGYYGKMTTKAIQKFQIKYEVVKKNATSKTSGFGILGPKTRAKMNEIYQMMHQGRVPLFDL